MAIPEFGSAAVRPGGAGYGAALLDHALGLLVAHLSVPRGVAEWRFGPLVVVSAADAAASTAVGAALARGIADFPAADAVTWDGRRLDRELAAALAGDRLDRLAEACAASRLVVVDRLDQVTHAERQQALVHLVDTSSAAGAVWCASVARMPADDLLPQCISRLGGGLVVCMPPAPVTGSAPPAGGPSLGRIIRAAARYHDVPEEAVRGPSRRRSVAAARSLVMYLARRLTGRSFQAIGSDCGGRDHTTVIHGVRVCLARIACDPAFAADVERLATALGGAAPEDPGGRRHRRPGVGSRALAGALANRRRRRRRTA